MDSSLDLSKPLDSAMKNPNNQDMPLIDLSIFAPQKIHSNILPASLCKKLGAFVYKIDEQALYVVLQNPNDTHTKLLIARQLIHLAKPIVFCVESSFCFAWILRALIFIEGFYAQLDIGAMLEFLLQEAIALEASDIHIETKADYASVRFRIDGRLREIGRIELEDFSKLTTKLKLATSLDITESRLPQDGRMQKVLGGVEYDFRLSFVPLFGGESIVIRILYKHIQHITLDTLGLDEVVCTHLRRAIMHKNGLILVVGPTGSGKSTTLYALLEEIKTSQKKIITIEDPIEYQIPVATQIQLNQEIGFSFYEALKSVLRQDPDIIMVGEIRDAQTLELALNASLTGHLVLASLHSNDCITSLERLFEMGAPRSVVETSLLCVLAQRLVGRLCPHCKTEVGGRFEARGCDKCNGSGIIGRVVVAQNLFIDEELRRVFWEGNTIAESSVASDASHWRIALRRALLARNLPTLKQSALQKRDIIDWREIEALD